MWLFTTIGLFSVVAARDGARVSRTRVVVRARDREHLEQLRERLTRPPAILESTERDYQFRIVISRATWYRLANDLAREVDYDNFKAEVLRREGHTDYEAALHQVWSVARRSLDRRPSAPGPVGRLFADGDGGE